MEFDSNLKPTLLDEILKYGLLIGALFQLICLTAIILVPNQTVDKNNSNQESKQMSNFLHNFRAKHHRKKQDKKKRK